MNCNVFAERIARVSGSLQEMADNIAYIRGELASLGVGDQIRASIRASIGTICDEFDSALYDVRKEVWTLADALAPSKENVELDSTEAGSDPKVTRSLISSWLRQEIEKLHFLVTTLQSDPAMTMAYILVAESAVNIYRAFSVIEEELDAIVSAAGGADHG